MDGRIVEGLETKKEDTAKQKESSAKRPSLWFVAVAFVFVIALWLLNWFYGSSLPDTERGIFGDTFGAVNALFSGLAFVGVIYAILMQRYEIALTKEDAATTKKILDEQSGHLEKQLLNERRRSFEDTFFKMLTLFMEVTESVTCVEGRSDGRHIYKGRFAIEVLAHKIHPSTIYAERTLSQHESYVLAFIREYGASVSHYLRNLESLLTFLNISSQVDRLFYGGIIRGHISDAEQGLIFHFCLRPEAANLKRLVEKYSLFVGIKDEYVIFPELKDRYYGSAFEARYSLIYDD